MYAEMHSCKMDRFLGTHKGAIKSQSNDTSVVLKEFKIILTYSGNYVGYGVESCERILHTVAETSDDLPQ